MFSELSWLLSIHSESRYSLSLSSTVRKYQCDAAPWFFAKKKSKEKKTKKKKKENAEETKETTERKVFHGSSALSIRGVYRRQDSSVSSKI